MTDDDDFLAGEYVLGTLDAAERDAATIRRLTDASFDTAVMDWERLLEPLQEAMPAIEAPARLWSSIDARVRSERGDRRPSATVIRLESSLRRWKRTAQATMALAAMLALWVAVYPALQPRRGGATLVAVLEPADRQPAILIRADLHAREMSVDQLAAQAPAGKSFQLWLIDPSLAAPKSLGLLHGGDAVRPELSGLSADVLARATYAVSVEPEGGSPTGAPSGAPVYTGHLLRTDPGSP